jgi:hypothetical protein
VSNESKSWLVAGAKALALVAAIVGAVLLVKACPALFLIFIWAVTVGFLTVLLKHS